LIPSEKTTIVIDSGVEPEDDNLPNDGLPGVTEIVVSFETAPGDTVEISGVYLKACNIPCMYSIYTAYK
jgi:hypothetical protein